jgi:hypothetical protein
MRRLSGRQRLVCGELNMHVQCRLNRAEWRAVYWVPHWQVQVIDRRCRVQRLCSRDIFGIDRSSSVHELRGRDVFDNSRGRCKFDMCLLSVSRHQLT